MPRSGFPLQDGVCRVVGQEACRQRALELMGLCQDFDVLNGGHLAPSPHDLSTQFTTQVSDHCLAQYPRLFSAAFELSEEPALRWFPLPGPALGDGRRCGADRFGLSGVPRSGGSASDLPAHTREKE